jgi:hypothetical protein
MIIPTYNINDIEYVYDFDNNGIAHSYPNTPPGYSNPQILYSFTYDGMLKNTQWCKNYTWKVDPPFHIISGQNESKVTCQLMPMLTKERENIIKGIKRLNYSELNLTLGTWKETLNLYYNKGPYWKIEGNKSPIIKYSSNGKPIESIETYTLVPLYDQSGVPPKYSTDRDSYSFNIKNGKVMQFYGTNPPLGYPKVDIFWYLPGPAYLSFYSAWSDYSVKFPNTLDIYVK